MKTVVLADYAELSEQAAQLICRQIKQKPDSVLGLATGGTPLGLYRKLVQMYQAGEVDFSSAAVVALDEYLGLAPDHPASYHYYLKKHLLGHINIKQTRIHLPDGTAADPEQECLRYEQKLKQIGVDLQILGMGHNGHIGFNEPGTSFSAETHVTALTASTRRANARYFSGEDEVPTHAISMGIATIMRAKKLMLLVAGEEKAGIVKQALRGPVTEEVPASAIQGHDDVTALLEQESAQTLNAR